MGEACTAKMTHKLATGCMHTPSTPMHQQTIDDWNATTAMQCGCLDGNLKCGRNKQLWSAFFILVAFLFMVNVPYSAVRPPPRIPIEHFNALLQDIQACIAPTGVVQVCDWVSMQITSKEKRWCARTHYPLKDCIVMHLYWLVKNPNTRQWRGMIDVC